MSSITSLPQADIKVKFLFDASTEELIEQGITEYVDVCADGRELRYVIRNGVRYQCFANDGRPFEVDEACVHFPVGMDRPTVSTEPLSEEDIAILEEMYEIERAENDDMRLMAAGVW